MSKQFPVTEKQVRAWAATFPLGKAIATRGSSTSCPLACAARYYGHEVSVLSNSWQDLFWHNLSPRWRRFVKKIDLGPSDVTAGQVLKVLEATK